MQEVARTVVTPDRWRVVSPYLDDALALPPEALPRWLADVRARDATIADDLERLLAARTDVSRVGFLDGSLLPRDATLRGARLGPYTLLSPLGRGGMGTVWLAERSDGRFEGRVAVKLLDASLVGREGEARFVREGTVLARLTHPNVARLLDAGVSEFGQPYLVLEYVEGEHIDRYCDRHDLGVEARVRLFLEVLDAVAHAHAHLVVHRDLKPSNVLVRADGRPALLDFGIAKLLEDGRETPDGPLTVDGALLLTPEYAAPEQALGHPVTTAADVYALGLLLTVLLGAPHPRAGRARTMAELIDDIVHAVPPRPSSVSRFGKAVGPELDAIVATALKKAPGERYASVSAFADDLRRYLRCEPVSARPDAMAYRATVFVRRHARVVTAAVLVGVAVLGLVVFYTWRLAAERDRAHMEAAKAARVAELVTSLLEGADPYATREEGEPTVGGILQAGAARVRRDLADEPALRGEMLTVLGRVHQRIGRYGEASPLLDEAVALARQQDPGGSLRLAFALTELGVLHRQRGDAAAAIPVLQEALAMRRGLGAPDKDVAVTLVELGRAEEDAGQLAEADAHYREGIAIRRRVFGARHRETATALTDLGLLLRLRGELDAAEPLLREALDTSLAVLGPDHPNIGAAWNNLGLLLLDRGDAAAAEPVLRRALTIRQQQFGTAHASLGTSLVNLAAALREQGKLDEAHAALRRADTLVRAGYGGQHPAMTPIISGLGAVHLARGDAERAVPLLREALERQQATQRPDDWRIAATRSALGAALADLGRHDEAESHLRAAVEGLRDVPGRQGREAARARERLAGLSDHVTSPPERVSASASRLR